MALKIRLRQQGRTGHRKYRLVVTEATARRDGKYVENVGHYDPEIEGDEAIVIKPERIQYWVEHGAQLTENASSLVQRVAPQIVSSTKERERAKRAKAQAKRRARRQAKAKA